ncbi:hypothetical protein JXB01_02605 [Candidatus Micrarchaeota archaeon]|nr:hypothetical protein [Candidatus Micrarchaeota archaeon]
MLENHFKTAVSILAERGYAEPLIAFYKEAKGENDRWIIKNGILRCLEICGEEGKIENIWEIAEDKELAVFKPNVKNALKKGIQKCGEEGELACIVEFMDEHREKLDKDLIECVISAIEAGIPVCERKGWEMDLAFAIRFLANNRGKKTAELEKKARRIFKKIGFDHTGTIREYIERKNRLEDDGVLSKGKPKRRRNRTAKPPGKQIALKL